jgi:hypothetical protein
MSEASRDVGVPGKGSWFSRAANKVATVASSVSAKTAAVLDFHSGAADVIVVKHVGADGEVQFRSTGWAVHAGRDNKTTLSEETVDVFLNGHLTDLRMFVGDDHNCFFGGGADRPQPADLEELELRDGPNTLGFSVSSAPNTRFTAELWVWPADVAMVICDIDGTITRSDVVGYGAHKLGFDATHSGVCEAFRAIERQGYRTIYLSARPITKAAKTREMLAQVGQKESGFEMPSGPLITTSERSLEALVRSFRRKGSGADQFKLSALLDIASAFEVQVNGRSCCRARVFYGGFGNRPSDAQAYSAAGVPANRIFIIDESSRLSLRETREVYASYSELISSVPRYFPHAHVVLEREAHEQAVYDDDASDDSDQLSGTQYVAQTSPSLRAQSGREAAAPARTSDVPPIEAVQFIDEQENGVRSAVGLSAREYQPDSSEEDTPDHGEDAGSSKPGNSIRNEDAQRCAEERAGAVGAGGGREGQGHVIARPGSGSNTGEELGRAGTDGQVGKSGEGAPAPEEEEEEDFDPDVWRRKQKKIMRAQRVAEANSRWGFTADGREPSVLGDQRVGGGLGNHNGVCFRADGDSNRAVGRGAPAASISSTLGAPAASISSTLGAPAASISSTPAHGGGVAIAQGVAALRSSEIQTVSLPAREDGPGEGTAAPLAHPSVGERGNAAGPRVITVEHGDSGDQGGDQASKHSLLSLLSKKSPVPPEDLSDITVEQSAPNARAHSPNNSENTNGNLPLPAGMIPKEP